MPIHDFTDFLKLSSVLNYNLSASSPNRYNVLLFILGGKPLLQTGRSDREAKGILMEALSYLMGAYHLKRRRLGPMAVLHPMRAAALFARVHEGAHLVDILSMLFHDVLEDIRPQHFEAHRWRELETQLHDLIARLNANEEAVLCHRLLYLTKVPGESYYHYIDRLLQNAADDRFTTVQVKLADRLDNTLDMRIELQDPLEGVDFFRCIFQLLFVNNYSGYRATMDHPGSSPLNGSRRLYQLFKNTVLLSLIRQRQMGSNDHHPLQRIFNAVADASLKEAQRTLLHLIAYHCQDIAEQRGLLLDAMDYCYSGKSDLATKPNSAFLLDGLFSYYFGHTVKATLDQRLDMLYGDKPLMVQASIAFIVIFLSFMNQPDFFIKGVSAEGIEPA